MTLNYFCVKTLRLCHIYLTSILCSKSSLNGTHKYLLISGVPVSTQWEPNGHHYPIQIAQFALSHYSKYLRDREPDRLVLMTGKEDDIEDWSQDGKTFLRSMWDKSRLSEVLEFRSSSGNIYIFEASLNESLHFCNRS